MLERTRLLIIDDWGPEPLTAEQRRDLLEIVDDRYEKGSLLVTSQVPVTRWHELVGDPTIGDAILDRVVHRAHRIELKGPSSTQASRCQCSDGGRQLCRCPMNAGPLRACRSRRRSRGSPGYHPLHCVT